MIRLFPAPARRRKVQKLAGGDDPEQSVEEFRRLSGKGQSHGWRFDRSEW
jgi:hypothetical protein